MKTGMAATVWRGRLAFGMVSIPIRLYKAARRERIRFHHVYRSKETRAFEVPGEEKDAPDVEVGDGDGSKPVLAAPVMGARVARVRNLPAAEGGEVPIEKPQILKGYEVEKDRYVTFEPREVAALRPETSTELAIGQFVRVEEIDPIFFDTSYYAAPDGAGGKPYALLYRALAETGYAGLGRLAMHGREHAMLIRAGRRGLILHTLFYANEVRAGDEYTADADLVQEKELELAKRLTGALAAKFDPAGLKDEFEERLREAIDERRRAGVPEQARPERREPAPVVDILEALRKSIAAARKPPESEKGRGERRRRARS